MTEAERVAAASATVWEAFEATAAVHPDNVFLCIPRREGRGYAPEGLELTYAEAQAEAARRAAIFRARGYGPGHRVALALENRPDHFLTQLALYAVGACQVPVNPDYKDHELDYLLEHSEADLALGLPHNMDWLRRAADARGVPSREVSELSEIPDAPRPANGEAGRETEAALIYTSGTTGRPKGCVIDHEYHFAVGLWYAKLGGRLTLNHGEERLFVPLPVFHVNAGINTLTAVILTANCLILPDRFHAETWWRDLAETRATGMHYLGVIPPILQKKPDTPEERAHSVRFGLGAGLDPAIHQAFEDRFGIPMVEVWGMTETGRFLADNNEPRRTDTRAFGKPFAEMEAKVVDENNVELPRGEAGELVVRAKGDDPRHGFFRGYLKNEEETEKVWRGGWFHTGDVAAQDEDGMLYFVERRKNIIRRSGENVSAADVENALIDHPAIDGVAVIGVADELRDEEIMACVVTSGPRDRAAAEAMLAHVRDRLAYYKWPAWVAFVDHLPRTGTEKVRKGLIFPDHEDPRTAPGVFDLRDLKKRSA